jgi:hypothetical protein
MLLKGEALIATVTIGFTVHGKSGEWTITTKAPGNITSECETQESTPYPLLDEMISAAFEAVCLKFPGRSPCR